MSSVRPIAFYLPQFHQIPENDQWWGEGFTEWTNVKKARPRFPDHYQPHVPLELGYYDLRNPEVRQYQADLAKESGIFGFCYYHYWFQGKRLLERPLDEVLSSSQPDFPFCLCWANESWTRNWDGGNKELLIKQIYSDEDDKEHIRWLISAFLDPRYIRVDNKPLFLVYRASRLPNALKTTSIWRKEAEKAGISDLFLCRVESFPSEHTDPHALGFDAAVEFQPDWSYWPIYRRIIKRISLELGIRYTDVYDYSAMIQRMMKKREPSYRRFPCVTPSWDNSPRNKTQTTILRGSTPQLYEIWLRDVLRNLPKSHAGQKLVFINAWNEWGESNHLEPCERWGRAYLRATRAALEAI